jgi:hypothetical protein
MRFLDRMHWWLKDIWLTVRYGEWVVLREFSHYKDDPGFGLAQVKKEGAEINYDAGVVYEYFAACKRSNDLILCGSKREAEGIIAINNDSRGLEDSNPNGC